MASHITLPLGLVFLLALTSTSTAKASGSSFIKSSCSITRYPDVCVDSLSTYADSIHESPKQLAQAALTVSLTKARSVKAFVTQMSKSMGMQKTEYQLLKDCLENIGDSVDRLSTSITELGNTGKGREESFIWHMSNVQTWVSAALTDDTTCMDGFAERPVDGKLKTAVKARITSVAQVTSNALALINQFANT